ncbi:MAG: hypothetical protein HY744_19280 [Deltaproteobacteria bacterium]|nr:hypothetical protein [Deltaproteobacteria bacterium]
MMRPRAKMLRGLQGLVRELLSEQERGSAGTRLSRAQGYVDGYMRAMLDAGDATGPELLALVGEERRHLHGPATRELAWTDSTEEAA